MSVQTRFNYTAILPTETALLVEMNKSIIGRIIEPDLIHLIKLRASQINDCAFCVDMHTKESRIAGIGELKLAHLAVWTESPLFSEKEKAALAWTEALTRLEPGRISDELYDSVSGFFTDEELGILSFAVCIINTWNRLSVATKAVPGSLDRLYGLEKAGLSS